MNGVATSIFIFGALAANTVGAQDANPDPIDVQLDQCLQDTTGETTAGMLQCVSLAYKAWDAELNKVYEDLLQQLSPESQESLRLSQQAWVTYRDAQVQLNGRVYYEELHGSLYHLSAALSNTDLTKQRVLELRGVLADLREGK